MKKKLIDFLSEYITPERNLLFEEVLSRRTTYLTVVLEDIFQPQNASAVLRTCDCIGIQNLHVIENRNSFKVDTEVAMGSSKWLSIYKYNQHQNNSIEAINKLKKEGYRIVATTPHKNELLLPDFDLTKGKAALVFGSELPGISQAIQDEADEFLKIPMAGFTESFNISVSAAIILFQLTQKLKSLPGVEWQLTQEEKENVKLQWLRKTIKRSSLLEQRFREEQNLTENFRHKD